MLKSLYVHEIRGGMLLDSRGDPTVRASVTLDDGEFLVTGEASAPSGASTGKYEAHELRDNAPAYGKKGVTQALASIREIAEAFVGSAYTSQAAWDKALLSLDGSENKSRLGANAILPVSLAAARAAAESSELPLYRFLGGEGVGTLPVPMLNVINGGAHAKNNVDIQEFMLLPVGAPSFSEALRWSSEVYHTLKGILEAQGYSTGVGDEGGFAPNLKRDEDALKLLVSAIESAGFSPGYDFLLAIDAAVSDWYDHGESAYFLPKAKKRMTREQMVRWWKTLAEKYPLISIEDGMGEDDHDGWALLKRSLGSSLLLVGDDYFVTNPERIEKYAENATALLVKPNQIGTLTETLEAIRTGREKGLRPVISHRSGETSDSFIADLAVAVSAPLIKAGAPVRGERTAKYNRLLEIEEELGDTARYSGKSAVKIK